MKKENGGVSTGTAAMVAGLTVFIPLAPYAEFYVFEKLIIHDDAARTVQNIMQHPKLFLSGIFAILVIFIIDVMVAWAIYIFLKPVNASLSLLAAWFRLLSVMLAVVALFNYLEVFQLLSSSNSSAVVDNREIFQLVNARRTGNQIAYIFFGIYLILIGMLIYKATYIPKVLGGLVALAGLSWVVVSLKPYFLKEYDLSWMMFFSAGELFWMIWLLVKGRKMKERLQNSSQNF